MALQNFDFEGTNGAVIAGTGIALQGAGSAVYSTADAVVGNTGARFTATAGNARSARCTITSAKVYGFNLYLRTPAAPPSATYQMWTGRHASGIILAVEYTAAQGVSVYEQTGAIRTPVPSVTVATGTYVRVQLLVSVGVSTNDSTLTAKVFSTASNWTTQLGTTLTRTGINLGTNAFAAMDVGAITAATPGLIVGGDYLQADDGRTTDFTGPPAATAPTATAGASDLYPEVGATITLTSTGSTGSSLTYAWTPTAWPDGASSPAITNPSSASASFIPAAGGRYTFNLRVTSAGLTDDAQVTVFVHPHPADDVLVFSVTPGLWTLGGGASTFLSAVNGGTGYLQSVTNPTGQKARMVMNPYGPGSVNFYILGNWTGGTLNRTVDIYMEDGVTLLVTETYALTSVEVEHLITLDTGDLATASPGLNRRALVVDVSDGP